MKIFYSLASAVPRPVYLGVALSLYLLMLFMGSAEPAVDALPGRESYSKIYHLVFYGGLAGLLWFGLRTATVSSITLLIACAGAIDELNQYFLLFRHGRLSDVVLDTLAGATVAVILHHMRRQAGPMWPAR